MNSATTLPVQQHERSEILDILRGFAVFGIYVNNSINFSSYLFLSEEDKSRFNTAGSDEVLRALEVLLVEGKFYSIFSLLFGIGFSIILLRNQERGNAPLKIFYRRLLILMGFGLAHSFLLWDGDILLLYSLIGMILPLFRKLSDKSLLRLALFFILSPILIDSVRILFNWSPGRILFETGQKLDARNGIPADPAQYAYYLSAENAGYPEILKWCASGFFYRYQYILDSNRIVKVLGLFLLGYYAGRKMIFARLDEYAGMLKRMMYAGFGLGIPAGLFMLYFETDRQYVPDSWMGLADTVFYALSVVPLSLGYTGLIALWWNSKKGKSFWRLFAPVGRMALTNYIMQTVISIFIFYNIGLGLGTRFGYTWVVLIVFVVYFFQVVCSTLWFRYFRFGPLEWIWRQLTYGKPIAIRLK